MNDYTTTKESNLGEFHSFSSWKFEFNFVLKSSDDFVLCVCVSGGGFSYSVQWPPFDL